MIKAEEAEDAALEAEAPAAEAKPKATEPAAPAASQAEPQPEPESEAQPEPAAAPQPAEPQEAAKTAAKAGPLDEIWARAEARRGRRWSYPTLDAAKTALIVCEPSDAMLESISGAQQIVAKINWLAEVLRGAGGRVGWSLFGADEVERVGDVLGERARAARRVAAAQAKRERISADFIVEGRDLVHTRKGYSAFFMGACHMAPILRSHGVDTVILAGFATNVEVDANARDAMASGYRVSIAGDACGAVDPALHYASLETLHTAFGDVRQAQQIVSLLRTEGVSGS